MPHSKVERGVVVLAPVLARAVDVADQHVTFNAHGTPVISIESEKWSAPTFTAAEGGIAVKKHDL